MPETLTQRRPTHAWCAPCGEMSAIDARKQCLWCGEPTQRVEPSTTSRLSPGVLRALHTNHLAGESIDDLVDRIYDDEPFHSREQAAAAITNGWRHLGLADDISFNTPPRKRRPLK